MEYARKPSVKEVVEPTSTILKPSTAATPDTQRLQRLAKLEAEMYRGTSKPLHAQRQAVGPIFRASELHAQETQRVEGPRAELQRQVAEIGGHLPPQAVEAALQRRAERSVPVVAPPRPQTPSDWVTVMRAQAGAVQAQQDAGRGLDSRQSASFTALQRQVAQTLVQGFRQDRQPPEARHGQYAEHLVSLQRHPLSASIARGVLGLMPQGERMRLQRAVDTALQRERDQQAQDEQALNLHALQRQLAELDAQATQPVFERIQARRGAGNPLPEAVQRHLEQGLNADLSRVRIHDDAEADKLAKGVNAIAFTTGSDIFFRSGTFNPNTQSGLELLAHEVTHVKQQAQGQVGPGVDPDPGLEAEARGMGAKLAQVMPSPKTLLPPSPHAPGVYSKGAALQRAQDGAAQTFALKPLLDLQPGGLQRAPDLSLQRWGNPLTWAADKAKAAAASALTAIPGYRELSLAFGKDLVTGKTMEGNPNAILDALAGWVPGPLKDILKALRETNAIPKAWAWFKAELGKLNLGGTLSEVTAAIGRADLGAAKNAITSRVGGLKSLIVGSARKIAEIGLTALAAGLGPIGQQVIAKLRSSGDLIIQVFKNPAKFAGNLLNALKGGFSGFARNAPKHLQNGLGQWLTGASGITFPAKLDLQGVFLTALSVMGLTYQVLRGKLVRQLGGGGEQKVQQAERTVGALQTLKSGIQKADEMKASQGSVGGEVTGNLKSEVTKSVVLAGITKVATMLIPGGGFVQALIGAFRSVQFLIEQGKQIMGVVTSAISSVSAIAAGNIGSAVGHVESTLARSIPVALGFLGKLIGIGNIGSKIKAVIQKVRGKLDSVVDKVVQRISKVVAKVLDKLPSSKKGASPQDVAERNRSLPEAQKQKKLDDAVTAIRGQLKPSLDKGMKDADLQRQLAALKRQYDLTSLNLSKQGAAFEITATVNPSKNVLKGFTPLERHVLKVANEVGEEVMSDPRVRAAHARLIQQRQAGRGSASQPIQVQAGQHFGGASDFRSAVASRRGGQSESFEINGRTVTETQSTYHQRQTVGTVEVAVQGGGSYPAIERSLAALRQDIIRSNPSFSPDRAESEIATLLELSAKGGLGGRAQGTYGQHLAELTRLLFSIEPGRNNSAAAFSPMMIESISRGTLTFREALTGRSDGRGIYPPSQKGAVRAMDRVERDLHNFDGAQGQSVDKKLVEQRDRQLLFCKRWIQQRMQWLDMDFDDEASFKQYVETRYKADLLKAVLQYVKG